MLALVASVQSRVDVSLVCNSGVIGGCGGIGDFLVWVGPVVFAILVKYRRERPKKTSQLNGLSKEICHSLCDALRDVLWIGGVATGFGSDVAQVVVNEDPVVGVGIHRAVNNPNMPLALKNISN
jgi:hypothetical protein